LSENRDEELPSLPVIIMRFERRLDAVAAILTLVPFFWKS